MILSSQKTAFTLALLTSSFSAYALTPPEMDNSAYVLMDYTTGEILAQKNANEPLPPASLTKMMTSYIIEKNY